MKVFLGYASEHAESAREIYDFLGSLCDDVWFDKESLVGGDDWDRERAAAQREADFVVHLVSAEIFARPGVVNREINQTLELVKDQPIGATYVVFLRLDDLRMPVELIRFQYIDHFKDSWRDQLAQAVTKRHGQLGGTVFGGTPEKTTKVTEHPLIAGGVVQPSRVESSFSTKYYVLSSDHLQYPSDGIYWDFVNARLAAEALGGFVGATADFSRMDEHDQARVKETRVPFEWSFAMQEFFRRDAYLSVRSSVFYYMGGAHPNHGITTLNFLGPENGLCTINDLLDHDDGKVFRLVEYCKKVLLAMINGEGPVDYLANAFEDRKIIWNLVSQFNFDDRGLTINFSPYDVLPYAFGSHEVFVPWRFVTPLLSEQYKHLEDQFS